jgi:hypothetical protein
MADISLGQARRWVDLLDENTAAEVSRRL